MKNIPVIKVGIVVGSTDWLPSELTITKRKELVEKYRSLYEEDIYECSVVITDNEVSIKRAMKELEKAEVDAVALYYANYGPESAGTLFAQEFSGPVMLIAAAEEGEGPYMETRTDAMSGFINACYALKLRKTNAYIPSRPVGTLTECANNIHDFIVVARTLIAIKELKIISIAPRPSSYLAAYAPNHLLYDIGVEISEFSEMELFESFRKHEGDARIAGVVSEMEQELGNDGNRFPDTLPRLAQYEITLNDWIRNYKGNRKYVTLTSTCWPAFPVSFGFVPCDVNSRFTGKGYPIACEVDVFGALSEYIGQVVSEDSVALLNINNNIPERIYQKEIKGKQFHGREYAADDLFLAYHCGSTCSQKLNSCSSECHFVNNQLIGEEKAKGTLQGELIPGAVTIFRLQGSRDGVLRAYIAQGQSLPVHMDTYGGRGVIAVPEMGRFLRNVIIEKQFPNHTVVIWGHYGKQLVSILRQLGIEEIEYNHPRNIPYKGENVFDTFTEWF